MSNLYTEEELNKLLAGFKKNVSISELANILGRSPYGIVQKLWVLSKENPNIWDSIKAGNYRWKYERLLYRENNIKERKRLYRRRNIEKVRRYAKLYRQQNKNLVSKWKKRWYYKSYGWLQQKLYREMHKDEIKKLQRKWHKKFGKIYRMLNKDRIRLQQKRYREKNKAKIKELGKLYGMKNKDRIKRYNKNYYQANRSRIRIRQWLRYHRKSKGRERMRKEISQRLKNK